jgi:hypothetical protein
MSARREKRISFAYDKAQLSIYGVLTCFDSSGFAAIELP